MSHLFPSANIDYKPLTEYVSWFTNNTNPNYETIQLPPIQRNSVWDSNQIEKLWDSILRGFPIGSFLLSQRKKGDKTRSLYFGKQKESDNEGYFLLDGQQRTRAILLGFKANEESRLWIDLNPNLLFGNSEFNDRQFLLRLITNYQPWGMSDKNPKDKLHENEKYISRHELYGESIRYDYLVNINNEENGFDNGKKFSWPAKAKLPIPFDALINLCGGISGVFKEPEWEDVLKLIPMRYKSNSEKIKPSDHYFTILKAIKPLLNTDNNNDIRAVSFLKQNLEITQANDQQDFQDSMEVLFRRINSNGTKLEGEEMAYSLLKSSWDESYELVSAITSDKRIGYLFSSTGVVAAATRLARFNLGSNDEPQPTGPNFRRWIGEKNSEGKSPFLTQMKLLISIENEKSFFHQIMERFCNLVIYRGLEDVGIPRKLLLSIKPTLLHPVLIWLYQNIHNSDQDEVNRMRILRYLMFTLIGVPNNNKNNASKKAVEVLKKHFDHFPDFDIYKTWLDDKLCNKLPSFNSYAETIKKSADGLLRYWHEVMGSEDDEYRNFRNAFWDNKSLLLWFQRSYHYKWFEGYNPMSNDDYDIPFDYDHILPKSHLITTGVSPAIYISNRDDAKKFLDCRHLYINSIGNYRAWPRWANRSDNNQCHTLKLRINKEDVVLDELAIELHFTSNLEFLISSAIDEKDSFLWKQAKGDVRSWPEVRRIAWQHAVENRVLYLYNTLYNKFQFNCWEESTAMSLE